MSSDTQTEQPQLSETQRPSVAKMPRVRRLPRGLSFKRRDNTASTPTAEAVAGPATAAANKPDRTVRLEFWVTPDEHEHILRAAAQAEMDIEDLLRIRATWGPIDDYSDDPDYKPTGWEPVRLSPEGWAEWERINAEPPRDIPSIRALRDRCAPFFISE